MRAWLDDAPLTVTAPTIAAGLDAARRRAESSGRVVVEATIDGHPIPESVLLEPPVDEVDAELRFLSADPGELVANTLRGVAETLAAAKSDQQAAAELIQTGRMPEAMERLQTALRTWETVRQVVADGCSLMGQPSDEVRITLATGDVRRLGDATAALAGALNEIKRAFGTQDWPALADALGFDLQDQADAWQDLLLGLAGAFAGRARITSAR